MVLTIPVSWRAAQPREHACARLRENWARAPGLFGLWGAACQAALRPPEQPGHPLGVIGIK